MKYTPMTEEEFDYRHSEIIEWYKVWNRLFWVGAVLFFISLFSDKLYVSLGVIGAQTLFVIFEYICRHKHNKLHEEYENGKR